jgi:hypothetical protein
VADRILGEPRLLGEVITVQVQNRVVDLAGTVGSLYARITAADLARSTPGVADVCNRLELARAADVSLAPDPFDEMVSHWDDPPFAESQAAGNDPLDGNDQPAGSAAPAQTFRIGSGLTAGVALVLWLVVVPEFGAIALLIVMPFAFAALGLARLARRAESSD